MATSKMFVHYSGTKAAFIAAGLPAQYSQKIVFIKGGENGTGEVGRVICTIRTSKST